jgi:hypothetical protein
MARTNIPLDVLNKANWAFTEITKTQADDTNDHDFDNSSPEKQIFLIFNEHATNPITVTVLTTGTVQGLAIADPQQVVAAGEYYAAAPMSVQFNQSGDSNKVYIDLTGTITDIYVAVLQLP